MFKYIKNHLKAKQGDVIDSHPNADYLLRLGVIEPHGEKLTKKGITKAVKKAAKKSN